MKAKYNTERLLIGLLIATLNPVFSGLVMGIYYIGQKDLRREGWIVLGFAIIWKVVVQTFLNGLNF